MNKKSKNFDKNSLDKTISYSYNTLQNLKTNSSLVREEDIDVSEWVPYFATKNQELVDSRLGKDMRLTLTMIVKNESSRIRACLESVKDIISYWVICDTGSDDDTISVIIDFMTENGISGKLYKCDWVNFAQNRTQMLKLAKGIGDYRLVMDADCQLVVENYDFIKKLDKSYHDYSLQLRSGDTYWWFMHLFSSKADFVYKGILHEIPRYIGKAEKKTGSVIEGLYIKSGFSKHNLYHTDRQKQWKETMDIALMRAGKLLDPSLSRRYDYHIALAYDRMNNAPRAIRYYNLVIADTSTSSDAWRSYSLYRKAYLSEKQAEDYMMVVKSYMKAYECGPSRLEPIYRAMNLLKNNQDNHHAFAIGKYAVKLTKLPLDTRMTLLETEIYFWKFFDSFSIIAYRVGEYDIAFLALWECLNNAQRSQKIPPNDAIRLLKNLNIFRIKASTEIKKHIASGIGSGYIGE